MQNVLLAGIVFYKKMIFQLQHVYGDVGVEVVFDEGARSVAIHECKEHNPSPADCSPLLSLCLMKLGDLTRCAMLLCFAKVQLSFQL